MQLRLSATTGQYVQIERLPKDLERHPEPYGRPQYHKSYGDRGDGGHVEEERAPHVLTPLEPRC